MVDMSPEAVGQRLRLMGELWELSVKLMNSTRLQNEEPENSGEIGDIGTGRDGAESQNREGEQ